MRNITLAKDLCKKRDRQSIKQLIDILLNGKKAAQNDAIKVLYEIGADEAALIAPYTGVFLELLYSKNNRIVWGCLTALAAISATDPKPVFAEIDSILEAADNGSVIANDQAVEILINLARDQKYLKTIGPVLLERLRQSPDNQFPMYAERMSVVLTNVYRAKFMTVLSKRLVQGIADSKQKRVERLIKKLSASITA